MKFSKFQNFKIRIRCNFQHSKTFRLLSGKIFKISKLKDCYQVKFSKFQNFKIVIRSNFQNFDCYQGKLLNFQNFKTLRLLPGAISSPFSPTSCWSELQNVNEFQEFQFLLSQRDIFIKNKLNLDPFQRLDILLLCCW